MFLRLLLVAIALLPATACHQPGCNGTAGFQGTVEDVVTGAPLYQAFVAVESGGLDVQAGNPNGGGTYAAGLMTDSHGKFNINLVCGNYGMHAFAPGYEAAELAGFNGTSQTIPMVTQNPNTAAPTITNVVINPNSATTNSRVTISATVTAAAGDPLSAHVLVIGNDTHLAAALTPPSAGGSSGYPSGVWSTTFSVSPSPGTHTYTVVAASLAQISATPVNASMTVHE